LACSISRAGAPADVLADHGGHRPSVIVAVFGWLAVARFGFGIAARSRFVAAAALNIGAINAVAMWLGTFGRQPA
jgi:hypothetical protein